MSEQPQFQRYEKEEEKEHEKEQEKEHEKGQAEKNWDEKWRRDPLSAAVWAAILIWAGVAFLASNLNILPNLGLDKAWGLVLTGAGAIVLAEVIVRVLVPAYRRPVGGTLILAAVLVGFGLSNLFGGDIVVPVILIAVGVGILLRHFLWRPS